MNVNLHSMCFIDTNVLVYAFDRTAGQKQAIAAQMVKACWENGTGRTSIQVLQELFITLTRKIPAPLDLQAARQLIADLALWPVHSPEVNDLLAAMDLLQRYRLSFWDAMILQSAARLGCRTMLSEDLNHGQVYGEVQVVNPFV